MSTHPRVDALLASSTKLHHSISGLHTRKKILGEDIKTMRGRMTQIAERKTVRVKAIGVLDRLIQAVAAQGVSRIETMVTKGLKLVFGPDLSFRVEKKVGARGTQYNLQVAHGEVAGNPMTMMGGGVVNVTAFLLRIIMLKRFKLAKFLALDESFNNVSESHIKKVSQLLQHLCTEQGFKMLFVTHQPLFADSANKVYMASPGSKSAGPSLTVLDPADV
jgi:ABC-type Mn2+/Zn2+ transport system ATPase subunit